MRTAALRILILVPLGLLLAFLAGFTLAAFAALRQLDSYADSWGGGPQEELFTFILPVMVLTGPAFLGAGFVMALVTEALALRSWLWHALLGALVAVVGCRLFALSGEDAVVGDEVALASGLAAGLLYWLVAGRTAGLADGR
jgi:hypothetical protein